MSVAEAKARITQAEFLDWMDWFELRCDLAEHGAKGVEAMEHDDDGNLDHQQIASDLQAVFSRMSR